MITLGEKPHPWQPGMTVADLLREIRGTEHCAVVRINESYITRPNFDHTTIPDGATVYLVPMIAGG